MAEQEEPVRRRVALKIIKLGMDRSFFAALAAILVCLSAGLAVSTLAWSRDRVAVPFQQGAHEGTTEHDKKARPRV